MDARLSKKGNVVVFVIVVVVAILRYLGLCREARMLRVTIVSLCQIQSARKILLSENQP